jgi:hypothetical protein
MAPMIETKAAAEARLMAIAFEFQTLLLDHVHQSGAPLHERYTAQEAEDLADEIQNLYRFFEIAGHG